MIAGRTAQGGLGATIYSGITSVSDDLANFNTDYAQGEIIVDQVAGENVDIGQLLFMDTNRKWYLTLANTNKVTYMLGICIKDAITDGNTQILLNGFYATPYHDEIGTDTDALPLYISPISSGHVTEVAPTTTGEYVRLIGHTYWNTAGQPNGIKIVRFNPDNTWILL